MPVSTLDTRWQSSGGAGQVDKTMCAIMTLKPCRFNII